MPTTSAKFTMRSELCLSFDSQLKYCRRTGRRRPRLLIVALYELWEGGSKGLLGRRVIDRDETDDIESVRIEVLQNAGHWFKRFDLDTLVDAKEVLANGRPASYFDYFDGPPELDFTYHDGQTNRKCNPSVECCLVKHYVNFTEIGWDKFIQYPVGFYANYCIGPPHLKCPHENPEVEYIL
ncbi:hypothetical protein OSTOST_18466, partial [Ostertagia ostertagi]